MFDDVSEHYAINGFVLERKLRIRIDHQLGDVRNATLSGVLHGNIGKLNEMNVVSSREEPFRNDSSASCDIYDNGSVAFYFWKKIIKREISFV